jgi:uncharacterized protein YegP (UPF0339 family)
MQFVVRQEPAGWRWELHNEFGEVLCKSAITFKSRDDAIDALKAVRSMAPRALVFDPLGTLYEGV